MLQWMERALLALSSRFFNEKNFIEKHDEKAELD